jgi:UDP-2,4-diacetamido-2,4,6-trideoxy-beta-L-altropyranose hydrolase
VGGGEAGTLSWWIYNNSNKAKRVAMDQRCRVIFRADGNSRIGLGHVVRSLALAHMLRGEFECVFAIQSPTEELKDQILEVCDGIISLPPCLPSEERFVHELAAYISEEEIVVLDGYVFGTAYQQHVKSRNATLVCLDDIHAFPFVADAVINQAGGVNETLYEVAPYTQLCIGPAYALLRPPFLAASQRERFLPEGDLRVLLNLGGADAENLTLKLAKELAAADNLKIVDIVVGAAYQHMSLLQTWLDENPEFTLHRNLTAEQMCHLMKQCAVAVTAASGVAYEFAAVGGLLFVLQTADNQEDLHRYLLTSGLAKDYQYMPDLLKNNPVQKAFADQVIIQRQHFDGKSPERLRKVFQKLSLSASLDIRDVTQADLMLLLEWANDKEVRKNSFNPNQITIEAHTSWFNAVLEDEQTLLYIITANGKPAAHIRFNIHSGTAVISYLVSAEFRGQGLGHLILLKGINKLKHQRPELNLVQGLVQQENIASVRAFVKAGFRLGEPDAGHPEALKFFQQLK